MSAFDSAAGDVVWELILLSKQVSEDHCWLNTDLEAGRGGTIEVTTDSATKRALPVDAAAWQGWLYSGGHAPLCSHKVLVPPQSVLNPPKQMPKGMKHMLRMVVLQDCHLADTTLHRALRQMSELRWPGVSNSHQLLLPTKFAHALLTPTLSISAFICSCVVV